LSATQLLFHPFVFLSIKRWSGRVFLSSFSIPDVSKITEEQIFETARNICYLILWQNSTVKPGHEATEKGKSRSAKNEYPQTET
jgi:hypothetical protein